MMNLKFLGTLVASSALLFSQTTLAVDPYAAPDESFISISGTVVSPSADFFLLDYGESVVTVEMDDWDSYGDAYPLLEGDRVTVYGRVDDDLYEVTSIEAGSVYVEGLNTYYYASSADEESASVIWTNVTPIVTGTATIRGTVTSVSPKDRTFTMDTGKQKLTIDTRQMAYNPLDDVGFQQIDEGDRLSVTGPIDNQFFKKRKLQANTIITLLDDSAQKRSGNGAEDASRSGTQGQASGNRSSNSQSQGSAQSNQ